MNVFAYGTLSFPDVLGALCGRAQRGEPAVLHGFLRREVHGSVYPAIVPAPGQRVHGMLYRNLSRLSLHCIAAFEIDEYRPQVCRVVAGRGAPVPALCYVAAPLLRRRLAARPWNPQAFATRHRGDYVRRCRRLHRAWRARRGDSR